MKLPSRTRLGKGLYAGGSEAAVDDLPIGIVVGEQGNSLKQQKRVEPNAVASGSST
jgi:hypothetical protein